MIIYFPNALNNKVDKLEKQLNCHIECLKAANVWTCTCTCTCTHAHAHISISLYLYNLDHLGMVYVEALF